MQNKWRRTQKHGSSLAQRLLVLPQDSLLKVLWKFGELCRITIASLRVFFAKRAPNWIRNSFTNVQKDFSLPKFILTDLHCRTPYFASLWGEGPICCALGLRKTRRGNFSISV